LASNPRDLAKYVKLIANRLAEVACLLIYNCETINIEYQSAHTNGVSNLWGLGISFTIMWHTHRQVWHLVSLPLPQVAVAAGTSSISSSGNGSWQASWWRKLSNLSKMDTSMAYRELKEN